MMSTSRGFRLTGNVKAVCTWIGNSPEVAMKHYAQITEADQREAARLSVLDGGIKRVHNRVQTGAVSPRTESHEESNGGGARLIQCTSVPHGVSPELLPTTLC